MAEFQGVSERFNASLVSNEGHGSERVVCQIGLDGLFVLSPDGKRTLKKYPLNHISRWALRGNSLVLYTKTPVDVEERTVTLQSDERTIRTMLDTLTCSCMQMVELLQDGGKSGEASEAATSINALLTGGAKKKAMLPTVDEVEFWNGAEKCGWLQSQGEHLKNWRRRWFVLKQGYLFRFAGPDINSGTKPRGVVDLSKVTDVTDGRGVTGRNLSIKLSTAAGQVCYVADSETEQVEWMSALEGAVTRIVKQVAGVEDEADAAVERPPSSWTQQLERSYGGGGGAQASRPTSLAASGLLNDRNTMVRIVGYDGGGSAQASDRAPAPVNNYEYGRNSFGGSVAGIAGIAGVVGEHDPQPRQQGGHSASSFTDSFVKADYPAYPVLAPTNSSAAPTYYSGQAAAQQAQQPEAYSSGYSDSPGAYFAHPQPGMQQLTPHQQSYIPVPHQAQQPAYGGTGLAGPAEYNSMPGSHEPQVPPQGGDGGQGPWQVHYTPEGRPYYHNAFTGGTQWEAPVGYA